MIVMLRPFAITGIGTTAYMKPLMLFLAYFKPFLAPEPVNSLEVDKPALFSQFYRYSAVTISWMLYI